VNEENQEEEEQEDVITPRKRDKVKEARSGGVRQDGRSKRWFREVSVQPIQIIDQQGYIVKLDGRIIRTPADNRLMLPTKELALSIAAEWDSMEEKIRPISMPLMGIASTALDVIPAKRASVISSLMNFIKNDTTIVRVNPRVFSLYEQQVQLYDPLLDWFSQEFQVPKLLMGDPGILVDDIQQPEELLTNIQWMLFHLDDWTLAALNCLTLELKSFVLSCAVWRRKIGFEEAFNLSRLEETFQIENNGRLAEHDVDEMNIKLKLSAGVLFVHLLPQKAVPRQ